MLDLKKEHFNALIEHYLRCCHRALSSFSSQVRSDSDFLDTEIPREESICEDLLGEIGRCVGEMQDLNARVQIT